ncbi:unnamed protein product, partial [Rotaria sp. Silwood1]
DIAEWFTPNDIMRLIELIRPDLLLLRTVVYNLISWESITNTTEWIEKQIPVALSKNAFQTEPSLNTYDAESITQAYCYLVSGVCFSLALKYAGTWNEQTANIIRTYFKQFQIYIDRPADYVENDPDCYAPDTITLEFVISTLVLSLAMVMAGSGDLQLLNLLQALQTRVGPDRAHVTYGSHVAVSMALGLLLLGGGRYGLRNDDDAIPILLAAFYPHFPMSSNDNRFHLQIFRHLYVIVCESRLMITKDISTQQICSVNGRLWINENNQIEIKNFCTPCFLPNFISIKKLEINDTNYWPIIYENDEQIQRLKQMLSRDGLFYVQKSSILSSLTLKKTSSSLVQLLSSNESSLRTSFHALQLYSGIQRIIAEPINNRHVKEIRALISFYEKYTSIKKLTNSTDTDDVILRTQFTNILFKNISKMKGDLLVALKNQHDSRRFGLLLPIREWLPELNEENLLSLLDEFDLSITFLENLSNELLCEIFDYLDGYHLFQAFSNLNSRFEQLIHSSCVLIKTRFCIYQNDKVLNTYLFSWYLFNSSFDRLESLLFKAIQSNTLMPMLNNLSSLPHLVSLTIETDSVEEQINDIYQLIFTLPTLKYYRITSFNYHRSITLPMAMNNQFSPIEYLVINHYCSLNELESLISYTPQLRRLTLHKTKTNDLNVTILSSTITLVNLQSISLDLCQTTFNELELFITKIFS